MPLPAHQTHLERLALADKPSIMLDSSGWILNALGLS
jgi:hypothetical protein